MFTLLTNPSSPAEIIKNGMSMYTSNLKHVLMLSFVATLAFLFPVYLPFIVSPSNLISISTKPNAANFIFFAVSWLISLILTLGLLFNLHCLCYGIKNNLSQVLKHAIYRFITTLLVGALYIIIVFSGTMLLIVPGFILSITLMFSFLLVVNENKGVLHSLMTSHQLIWGNWWHTFVVMSVPLLINLIIIFLTFIVMTSLISAKIISLSNWYYSAFIIQLVLQSLLLPFNFSIALILFNDLRIRQRKLQRPY